MRIPNLYSLPSWLRVSRLVGLVLYLFAIAHHDGMYAWWLEG
jgi:hypothetical protein